MLHHLKVFAATAGWIVAVTLMVFAANDHEPWLCAWSIFVTFAACVPTYWLMFDDHRAKVCRAFRQMLEEERARTDDLVAREREHTDAVIIRVAQEFAEAEIPRIRQA